MLTIDRVFSNIESKSQVHGRVIVRHGGESKPLSSRGRTIGKCCKKRADRSVHCDRQNGVIKAFRKTYTVQEGRKESRRWRKGSKRRDYQNWKASG